MANIDFRKTATPPDIQDVNVVNTVDIRDLSCDRDHPDICDRANRLLGIVSTITNPVDISDRCARLLGQICVSGAPIDPRQIRNLVFATDKVDVSGSNINATIVGTSDVNVTDRESRELGLVTMKDAFMELRLMADYLKDLQMAQDVSTGRVRTKIEESITLTATVATVNTVVSLTNIVNIGGRDARLFQDDITDKVWYEAIREQII